MTAMYGLFDTPQDAQRAFTSLRRAGVPEPDITVVSAEPFEAFGFAHRDHSLILFRLAVLGGIGGFILSTLLTTGTSRAWPMNTGGMPIIAWWPFLIVIFELTMLGAILTTVVSLLITGPLPSRKGAIYDKAVSDGKILVGVPLTGGSSSDAVRSALDSGGAVTVKTVEV